MRWVATLCALCLAMVWLHHLTAASALDARAGFALGFLLLTAWLAGELADRAHVPRLIGFLLLGMCVGPAWLNLVRPDELDALGFVAQGALVLIAFAAGQALVLGELWAERPTIIRLAAGTLGFPAIAVAAVVLSVAPWFPLTVHQGVRNAAGVALTLGACAAATSPIVIMSVLAERNARGPLATLALRVAAVNAVAVFGLLALALTVARGLGTAGMVDATVVSAFASRAVAAVVAGTAVGVLVSQYGARVQGEPVLALLALAVVVAAAHGAFGIDPTLTALAAGVAARNAGGSVGLGLRVLGDRGSLAAQTVLFSLTGAELRVGAFADLWPWVALLVGVRLVALRYGTVWAGRRGNLPPAVARYGWLGLVSQSGIAIALASVARRAFPAWGVSLEALIAATVVISELAGPVCVSWVLEHAARERPDPPVPLGAGGAALVPEWAPRSAGARSLRLPARSWPGVLAR
jgi:Kef-type K+ transport system membrane component KefB